MKNISLFHLIKNNKFAAGMFSAPEAPPAPAPTKPSNPPPAPQKPKRRLPTPDKSPYDPDDVPFTLPLPGPQNKEPQSSGQTRQRRPNPNIPPRSF